MVVLLQPPPSFQPQIPISTATPPPPTTQPASTSGSLPKPEGQDLISRYNLNSKVTSESLAEVPDPSCIPASRGWSQNKDERQRMLQKRRDDMILAARKKMMQKSQESAQ